MSTTDLIDITTSSKWQSSSNREIPVSTIDTLSTTTTCAQELLARVWPMKERRGKV
ncbi:hypothetical protein GBAR_LOCUS3309 [Geodia barretti]|uniref:Uncharacterized protein n=1 Tax=Geodia barretti TaxID=519541 RepID=A0AA35W0I2_GEOBA|nr:hypothetical protein GBAR_LOCUS3309 [Geodia barretti]